MSLKVTVIQGDDIDLNFTVKDKSENAINISGSTIDFSLYENFGASALVSKSTSNSPNDISITDAANGQFTVTLTNSDTSALNAGEYYFEAQITDSNSKVSTVRDLEDDVGVLTVKSDLI